MAHTVDDAHAFARGWFVASFSDELEPGVLRPWRHFGRDLVLFRTRGGEPRVADGHCPHCGAHLGHGGTVDVEAVRCPKHGLGFDGRGDCVEAPGHAPLPRVPRLRMWSVCERNGIVFVWHDPEDGPPDYEIPTIAEFGAPGWTRWSHSRLVVKTQPREIVENVADVAHFSVVHRFHIDAFENQLAGHTATQITRGHGEVDWGEGIRPVKSSATYYGPAYQVTHLAGHLDAVLVNAHTPIDAASLDLFFAVSVRAGASPQAEAIARSYIDAIRNGFFEDIAIWEHKRWRDAPLLCEGDGPIGPLRRWYAQFFRRRELPQSSV
jgi:3-ketosteroid 9alpha-monooxygenase subunit A